jgi:hypothetical protein
MSNPFQKLQNEYDTTLENIKQAEISEIKDPSNRNAEQNYVHYVDNFYKIKNDVSQLSNSMINKSQSLDIPQLRSQCNDSRDMFNLAYPNLANDLRPLNPPPVQTKNLSPFVNDMFLGSQQGPVMNVLDMTNNYRYLNDIKRFNRANTLGCTNSSFSNQINQAQFRSGSDVVSMMADNGRVYQFDNGNRANAPMCATSQSLDNYQDVEWLPQNLPTLTTMNKEKYLNNLTIANQQMATQQNSYKEIQRNASNNSMMNNPRNPIWKPLDSKYLN